MYKRQGYPWFLDWGRDTLISFEGLLLISKRYKIAKEVLLTMVRDVKYGLVPKMCIRDRGSERRETVRSLSVAGARYLKGAVLSTRGPGWTYRWWISCHTSGTAE